MFSKKYRRIRGCLSFCLILTAVECRGGAGNVLTLTDESRGCFSGRKAVTEYSLQGDSYRSKLKTVPASLIEKLRKIVADSKAMKTLEFGFLGVTPETVAAHRMEILAAALEGKAAGGISKEQEYLLEWPSVSSIAKSRLTLYDESTTQVKFTAVLSGSPEITISSEHNCPWMLPWKVKMGWRTWETYSADIPKILSELADPNGPNAEILEGSKYWKEDFWKDRDLWSYAVGRKLVGSSSENMAQGLKGYAAAAKIFITEEATRGLINSQPDSLFLQLKTKTDAPINSVWWFNHMKGDRPGADWNAMLKIYEQSSLIVSKHKWLADWKKAGTGRVIELHIAGDKAYSDTDMDDFVEPPWKDGRLSGKPEIELLLRDGKKWGATIFMSRTENRALITHAERRFPFIHWLDRMSFSFHPVNPDYVIVSPDGTYDKRRGPGK